MTASGSPNASVTEDGNHRRIGALQRLLFSALALALGSTALLLILVYSALRFDYALGQSQHSAIRPALLHALNNFCFLSGFAILGWILVGLPITLAVPARVISRVRCPTLTIIGASLGPLALVLIFVILLAPGGHLGQFSLAMNRVYLIFSIAVSTPSFLVYAGLLRWRLRAYEQ